MQTRWMVLSRFGPSVPISFLAILLIWLTFAFATFGLYAPRNGTVIAVLFVCALSVAIAIFLILEMDSPFDGLIKVSAEPLHYSEGALAAEPGAPLPSQGVRVLDREAIEAQLAKIDATIAGKIRQAARRRTERRQQAGRPGRALST